MTASAAGADGAPRFPFTAVVGQDLVKLALILNAVSPAIGGVLIRGEKGTAKSTIVRGLGPLIADSGNGADTGRVVELPIGATEDRVVGSLDLTTVLRDGRAEFTPGLLAQADGGALYIDEVNLLADHLVDVLLDAAASGRVTIERDGVSHTQAAAFVLVGTMNPEEGELRPQLLDRFGLAVDVTAGRDVAERVEIVSRRMEFDSDPVRFADRYAHAEAELAERIAHARRTVGSVRLPTAQLRRIAGICAHLQVDGLRADIVVARAATAHAALRGGDEVTADDIRVAVELAVPHRRRRNPFDEAGLTEQQLDDALAAGDEAAGDEAAGDTGPEQEAEPESEAAAAEGDSPVDPGNPDPDDPGPDDPGPDDPGGAPAPDAPGTDPTGQDTRTPAAGSTPPGGPFAPPPATSTRRVRTLRVTGIGDGEPGRRSRARGRRGHAVRATDFGPDTPLHLFGTVLAAAHRTAGTPMRVAADDLRGAERIGRESNLVVFVVDLSGSMTARRRLAAVGEVCVDLLRDSYTRRDRVAVVVARGSSARVVVPPTRSVDLALRGLADIRTGGRTPLAEGLVTAADVIAQARHRDPHRRPLLVALTDGRATAGADAAGRARTAARQIAGRGIDSVVVDCEQGMIRLGLAGDLAAHLDATYLRMDELSAAALAGPDPAGRPHTRRTAPHSAA